MVKQRKLLHDGGVPSKIQVCFRLTKREIRSMRRERLLRAQALKMISQRQAEVDSGNDPGGNGKGAGPSSGAVTPGGFSNGEGSKEFLSTARTGRRNALPHILGQQQQQQQDPGTADLPSRFEALTTDEQHNQPGPSGLGQSEAHCSQQHTG